MFCFVFESLIIAEDHTDRKSEKESERQRGDYFVLE